jgi:hypothetical protein
MGDAADANTTLSASEGSRPSRSASRLRISSEEAAAANGGTTTRSSRPAERCVSGSNARSEAIRSPSSSTRTGLSRSGGKTSKRPPRTARSPVSITRSPRRYPIPVRSFARPARDTEAPVSSVTAMSTSAAGDGRRVASARAGSTAASNEPAESAARSPNSSRRALRDGGIR